MKIILNIIWLATGGLVLALGYFLLGILACIPIVTIPAGVASMRMANFALWPFGRSVIQPVKGGSWWPACGWPSATSPPQRRRP